VVKVAYRNGSDAVVSELIDRRPLSFVQVRLVILAALAGLIEGFDLQILALVLPELTKVMSTEIGSFGLALSASMLGIGFSGLFIAPLGDRYGRRRLIVIGSLTMGASAFACGFATSVEQLVVLRFMTGVGLGMIPPNNYALVADMLPFRLRLRAIAIVSGTFSMGSLLAGFVASDIIAWVGWDGLFFVGGGVTFLAAVILYFGLPESYAVLAARGDERGFRATLARLGIPAPLSFTAERSSASGALNVKRNFSVLLSPEHRRSTLLALGFWATNAMSYYMLVSWLPSLLSLLGWAPTDARKFGSIVWVGGALGGLLMAWGIDTMRRKHRIVVTSLLLAMGAILLFTVTPHERMTGAILIVLIGLGLGGVQDICGAVVTLFFPPQLRATAVGNISAVVRLGAAAGPALGGYMLVSGMSPNLVLLALIVPMTLTATFITILFRTKTEA
jgi:AAHS family 4-hydroxybenzoate transporter-like MFS transporter